MITQIVTELGVQRFEECTELQKLMFHRLLRFLKVVVLRERKTNKRREKERTESVFTYFYLIWNSHNNNKIYNMTFCLCQQITRVKSDNVCRSTHHHLHEACQTPEGLHLILSHKEERRQEITHALNITCKHNRPQTKKKKRGNI